MNMDITASVKPEYPVIDRNPPFTTVVGNFSTLDYLRFVTITGISVSVGYLSDALLAMGDAPIRWFVIRDKARDQGTIHGDGWTYRIDGRVHNTTPGGSQTPFEEGWRNPSNQSESLTFERGGQPSVQCRAPSWVVRLVAGGSIRLNPC
ncbi:hypothetical protein MLD38_040823 [Melastoma candidum]|nr:hypothetical protein MLD38_040823 [Melastoma candidum]